MFFVSVGVERIVLSLSLSPLDFSSDNIPICPCFGVTENIVCFPVTMHMHDLDLADIYDQI